jgi:hypothetical protein
MDLQTATNEPAPGLMPLAEAARLAGVSADLLARACRARRIPVDLQCLGRRSRFVRAEQFRAWLASRTAPAASDLFN